MAGMAIERIKRKFTVEEGDGGGWKVTCGDRWEDHLGSDEALWTVVQLLISNGNPRYLHTDAEHREREARHEEAMRRLEQERTNV